MSRYQVVYESVSGHCCFEASVVDTSDVGGRNTVNKHGALICECFEPWDAELIAERLNAQEEQDETE